jgi:hydroxymethylglutaryl-CoA synthase
MRWNRPALDRSPAVGIASFGWYVPAARLDVRALAEQWGMSHAHERIFRLNGRNSVAVSALDEDATTVAIEAAERALAALPDGAALPRAIQLGSESHVYAVKPTAVIVAEALGLTPDVFVADLEFACKAGTAAVLSCAAAVAAGYVESALAIGADCPQSAPGTLLEASVGAGAAAFVLSARDPAVTIDAISSAASDVTDFWRRDTRPFPQVAGKFSVEKGYLEHSRRAVGQLFEATGTGPADYRYACFHQPYASLPMALGKSLGFRPEQIAPGLVAGRIGNTYSSATLLSLCAVLEAARPGERVLLASFGSGAGSDALALTVTERIEELRARLASRGGSGVARDLSPEGARWLTYGQYAHGQGKLRS